MKRCGFILILVMLGAPLLAQTLEKKLAYQHISNLQIGVVLIRLHADDAVVAKMKQLNQKNLLKAKLQEIEERNTAIYSAFQNGFSFTQMRFFYGRDSEKIKSGNYSGVFLDSNLNVDSNIHIPQNTPVYIIDVGDIYFEAFGGHFEGMVVMDKNLEPLKKPFPFYVRKRSGIAIIKRTDLDMVGKLQTEFEEFYDKARSEELVP